MFKFDVKGWALLGAWTGAALTGIGMLVAKFGGFTINFATIDVASSRGTLATIGKTILAKSPFAVGNSFVMALITMIIATIAVMLVGRALLDFLPNSVKNTVGKKVASVLVVGTLLAHLVLLRPAGLPAVTGIIALVVLSFLLSWVMVFLASVKFLPIRIPQN